MNNDFKIKGKLVLPDHVMSDGVISVKDGVITAVERFDQITDREDILDVGDQLVFPGFIDSHVHSFSNPEEGFEHSTKAAAAGGVTTMIEMPYDKAGATYSVKAFQEKIQKVEKDAMIDVALLATIKKQGNFEIIDPIVSMGACGFKMSVFETDPDRFPRIETDTLWDVFPILAEKNIPVGFHAEDDRLITSLIKRYRDSGRIDALAHCESRPPVSETLAALKLLELAYWTKVPLHLYHVSHPRTVELANLYRNMGTDVSVETCPHYLILNEFDMERLGALAKINPPLRKKCDVEKLWDHLLKGGIDTIASDHAPWPENLKNNPDIFKNASGASGLEALVPLSFAHAVVKRGMNVVHFADLLSKKPAERFGFSHCKGSIAIGKDADFAILDPDQTWVVDARSSASSSKFSPYDGTSVTGKVTCTILRGKVIFNNGTFYTDRNDGRYLRADHQSKNR